MVRLQTRFAQSVSVVFREKILEEPRVPKLLVVRDEAQPVVHWELIPVSNGYEVYSLHDLIGPVDLHV